MLPLVPFLASRAHASAFSTALAVMAYGVGSLICHQLPERSYHLWAAQMPVCARCAGIYFGAAIAAVVAGARLKPYPTYPSNGGRRFSGAAGARLTLVAATAPTLLTLAYEWATGHTPSNLIRAAAGVPVGAAVAWLVVAATRAEAAAENQVN